MAITSLLDGLYNDSFTDSGTHGGGVTQPMGGVTQPMGNVTQPMGDATEDLFYLAWLMPLIFSILIVVGVTGNTIVIFVIIRASQRTVTNYYIVNLAVADILFLGFCAPQTADTYTGTGFYLGRFMCKIVYYLQMVTAQATCFLLTAMSVDRLQVIVRPLRSLRTRTLQIAVAISLFIWLFAFLLYIPLLVFIDIQYGLKPFCVEMWPVAWSKGYVIVSFILVFSLPLIVIAVCYSIMIRHLWKRVVPNDALSGSGNAAITARNLRQKRRITWMVLAVVLVFAVCWFPIHVVNMWHRLDPNFPLTNATFRLKTAGHVMSYANSCANPFIYAFLGENFRKSFRRAFPWCFGKSRLTRRGNNPGGTTASQRGSTGGVSTGVGSVSSPSGSGNSTHMTNLNPTTDVNKNNMNTSKEDTVLITTAT